MTYTNRQTRIIYGLSLGMILAIPLFSMLREPSKQAAVLMVEKPIHSNRLQVQNETCFADEQLISQDELKAIGRAVKGLYAQTVQEPILRLSKNVAMEEEPVVPAGGFLQAYHPGEAVQVAVSEHEKNKLKKPVEDIRETSRSIHPTLSLQEGLKGENAESETWVPSGISAVESGHYIEPIHP